MKHQIEQLAEILADLKERAREDQDIQAELIRYREALEQIVNLRVTPGTNPHVTARRESIQMRLIAGNALAPSKFPTETEFIVQTFEIAKI